MSAALASTEGTQGVARDEGEASIAGGGLLTGLDDDACCVEFSESVICLTLVHWDVNEQAGRVLVIQKGVDLTPKLEERAVVTGDRSFREAEIGNDSPVVLLGVVPDDKSMVPHLLGDQVDQVFGDRLV